MPALKFFIITALLITCSCVQQNQDPAKIRVKMNIEEVELIPSESALNFLKSLDINQHFSEITFNNKFLVHKQILVSKPRTSGRVQLKQPEARTPENINYTDLRALNARSDTSIMIFIYNNENFLFMVNPRSSNKANSAKKIISALVSLGAKQQ